MTPISSLNPTGQFFELRLLEAWKLLEDEKFDAANAMSHALLLEPAMSNVHRAGFHIILAHSPYQPAEHAREALRLYRSLYEDSTPTERQLQAKQRFVDYAEGVLDRAIVAEATARNGYSEEEVQADIVREAGRLAVAEAAFEAAADAMGATGDLEVLFSDEVQSSPTMPEEIQNRTSIHLSKGKAVEPEWDSSMERATNPVMDSSIPDRNEEELV